MIYTVTFNPSFDYVIQVENMKLGTINRTKKEAVYPGGKGINVSVVLNELGIPNRALGFVAGFTGDALEQMLQEHGCDLDFIHLMDGMTRMNVKIKALEESEINGQGPTITEEALQQLFDRLDKLENGDSLVLAGSIPQSLPDNIYEIIIKRMQEKQINIVVDATKKLLQNVLKYHPFLIKPNQQELGELFETELHTTEEIIDCAKKLQLEGARNVLVSMAAKGAVLVTEEGYVEQILPPDGTVVNSVGAGDSMIAGFLAGYMKTRDYRKALELGTASGSASAFTAWLASKEAIVALLQGEAAEYGL